MVQFFMPHSVYFGGSVVGKASTIGIEISPSRTETFPYKQFFPALSTNLPPSVWLSDLTTYYSSSR